MPPLPMTPRSVWWALKGNPAEREPPVTRLRFEAPRNQRPKAQNSVPEQRVVSRRKNRLPERISPAIEVLPSIRRIQNASQASTGRFLPCLIMISNGQIKSAATAASAVAIAAFGSGVPKSQPAMIIVVPATTQIAATRVILRIANLLPRPESACRDAGNGKRSPANRHLHRTHDEPGAATLRVSYFTP